MLKVAIVFSSLFAMLAATIAEGLPAPPGQGNPPPIRQIDLRTMGYQAPKIQLSETSWFADPSHGYDDTRVRLAFVGGGVLAVYFSDPEEPAPPTLKKRTDVAEFDRTMEVFFVNLEKATLLSHEVLPARERRWPDERFDTEARIMPVRGGFLLHARDSLTLYSSDLQERRQISLDPRAMWAALVAPAGRAFFLEQIDPKSDADAQGRWLASDTFQTIRAARLYPGSAASVSEKAIAIRGVHCVDIGQVGEPPRHVCCEEPCGSGDPLFLDDAEIISSFLSGFRVLSASGDLLWARDAADPHIHLLAGLKRSMNGNRFAISTSWDQRTVFDDTRIPGGASAVFVYDQPKRERIFSVVLKPRNRWEFALSPDGQTLAVLDGAKLSLYALPQ
jgi:hypothetical protein